MKTTETTINIAYGSNQNISQMALRCPTAKMLGTAKLQGYRLLFRGGTGCSVATVEKQAKSSVPVVLWELGPSDEKALDWYEGVAGGLYRKETVKVRFKGKWIPVMVYLMNDGRSLGTPSKSYYNTILQGYKSAGFDTAILDDAVKASSGR